MGNYQGDPKIGIYFEVQQIYYVSGEEVKGVIYLDVKHERPYYSLGMTLYGEEHVYWCEQRYEKSDKRIPHVSNINEISQVADHKITHNNTLKVSHKNIYRNYQSYIEVCRFNNIIRSGQYMFPFRFRLPAMIPGTFYYGKNNYLMFFLVAEIKHNDGQSKNQKYSRPFNIIEPVRLSNQPVKLSKQLIIPSSCLSTYRPGKRKLEVALKKPSAFAGEDIEIYFRSQSNQRYNIGVQLHQKRAMISKQGCTSYPTDKVYDLGSFKIISNGENPIIVNIPKKICKPTAIGSITAFYYLVIIKLENGCCTEMYSFGEIEFHLFVRVKSPKIMETQRIARPNYWNPQQKDEIYFRDMKPFKHLLSKKIPYFNLPDSSNLNYTGTHSGYYPQFKKNPSLSHRVSKTPKMQKIEQYLDSDRGMLEKNYNTSQISHKTMKKQQTQRQPKKELNMETNIQRYEGRSRRREREER